MQNLRNFTIFSYFILTFLSLCASNNEDINTLELSLAEIAHHYFADVMKADNDSGKDESELYAQIMGDEIELELTNSVASDLEGELSLSTSNNANGLDDDVMRVVRSLAKEREEDIAFLGTNLFSGYRKPCFTKAEIALLQMRRDFELVIPKGFPKHLLTDKKVCALMKYFGRVNDLLAKIRNDDTQYDAQRAFYDTLGGYLRYRVVPVAKISFYAGQMRLCTVDRLIHLLNECKLALNTNGNGWKTPRRDLIERLRVGEVEPIRPIIYKTAEPNACTLLDLHSVIRDADNVGMLVGLPKLEPEDDNGCVLNIALPFKKRRIYNIRSPQSAFIIVRFFLVVTRCYEVSGICQNMYNERFKAWIDEELEPHFYDERFYPGFGGILRVYETLANPSAVANAPDYISAVQEKGSNPLDPTNSDMPAFVINSGGNGIKATSSAEKDSILDQAIGLMTLESESDSDANFETTSKSDSNSDANFETTSKSDSDSDSDDSLIDKNRTNKKKKLQKRPGRKSRKRQRHKENISSKSVQWWSNNSTNRYSSSTPWPWELALNTSNKKSHSNINLSTDNEHFWDCWFDSSKYILYICFLLLAVLIVLFLITVYNLYGLIGCDKSCINKNPRMQTSETEESEVEKGKKRKQQQQPEPERKRRGKQRDNLRKSEEGCCSKIFGKKRNQSRPNARRKKPDEVIVITSNSQSVQPTKEREEQPRKQKKKPKVKSSSRHRPKSKERKPGLLSKRPIKASTKSEVKPQPQRNYKQDESPLPKSSASETSEPCLCEHLDTLSQCPICSAQQRKNAGRDVRYKRL